MEGRVHTYIHTDRHTYIGPPEPSRHPTSSGKGVHPTDRAPGEVPCMRARGGQGAGTAGQPAASAHCNIATQILGAQHRRQGSDPAPCPDCLHHIRRTSTMRYRRPDNGALRPTLDGGCAILSGLFLSRGPAPADAHHRSFQAPHSAPRLLDGETLWGKRRG
jgi:hypothetical protein